MPRPPTHGDVLLDLLWDGHATAATLTAATGRDIHDTHKTLVRLWRQRLVRRSGKPFMYSLSSQGVARVRGVDISGPLPSKDRARAAEASAALNRGEVPWDAAARLGYRSADAMVDAVQAWRRASAVVADGGRATGRDIPRGEVTSSPSPRPATTRTPNPRSTP